MPNKPYDPKPTKYKFPKYTDGHYLVVKKNDHAKFDKDFPYIDKSKKFKRRFKAFRILVVGLAMPVMAVRVLLKVEGRKNIRKHKEILKQGVVSISNHVHIWDYIAVMDAIRPFIPYHPSWATNCRGENKTLIRYTGGVPVPEGDIRASYQFTKAIEEHISNGGWFHTYAEGSMWEGYQPIRPFKKGAFRWAVKTGKPILPLAFSYRKPKGLVRLIWGKNAPLLTIRIGEPIFPDMTIPTPQAIEKLTIEAHQAVCRLAGIEPSENIYPPVYENTLRIDYYDNPNAEPLDDSVAAEMEAFDKLDQMIADFKKVKSHKDNALYNSFFEVHKFICDLEDQGMLVTNSCKSISYLKEILVNDGPEYAMVIQFASKSFPDRKYEIGVCVRGTPLLKKVK